MYLEHWGFQKFPFDNVPDPEFFYLSKPHKEALTRLIYAVERGKGCAMVAGDVGCGKTALSKVFLQRIAGEDKYDVAVVSNPCLTPAEFLQDVLHKFNANGVPHSKVELLHALSDKLTENNRDGRETLLIVDESQLLTKDTLEEIRLLLNFQMESRFMITVFLVGQPEMVDKIRRMRELEQRIAIKYELKPFNLDDTAKYILFRQQKAGAEKNVFSNRAIEMIYEHTRGLPRSINNLCDLSLLVGFSEDKNAVNSGIITDVIEDGAVF
jgi:general secretion pathway protein A